MLLFIGIVLIVVGYTKSTLKCPPPKIEYRFVPRNFFEEQISPDQVSKNFQSMFSSDSWMDSNTNESSVENISSSVNNFYHSSN